MDNFEKNKPFDALVYYGELVGIQIQVLSDALSLLEFQIEVIQNFYTLCIECFDWGTRLWDLDIQILRKDLISLDRNGLIRNTLRRPVNVRISVFMTSRRSSSVAFSRISFWRSRSFNSMLWRLCSMVRTTSFCRSLSALSVCFSLSTARLYRVVREWTKMEINNVLQFCWQRIEFNSNIIRGFCGTCRNKITLQTHNIMLSPCDLPSQPDYSLDMVFQNEDVLHLSLNVVKHFHRLNWII